MSARKLTAAGYAPRAQFSQFIENLESRRLLSVAHPVDESAAESSDSSVSSDSEHAAPAAVPAKTSPTVATESSDSSEASDAATSTPAVAQSSVSRAARTSSSDSQSAGAAGNSSSRNASSGANDSAASGSSSDAQRGETADTSGASNAPNNSATDQQSSASQTDSAVASAARASSSRSTAQTQTAAGQEPIATLPLREARPIALAAKLPPLISALRIAVEPKLAPTEVTLTAQPLQAVAGVAQMASDAASTVEAVVQVLPQIGQLAIPRLIPLNVLTGLADAISSFAHESAALGTAIVSAGNHKLAWAVTFTVVAADAILVGRWRMNRRRPQAVAAEACRPLFSLRRVKR